MYIVFAFDYVLRSMESDYRNHAVYYCLFCPIHYIQIHHFVLHNRYNLDSFWSDMDLLNLMDACRNSGRATAIIEGTDRMSYSHHHICL